MDPQVQTVAAQLVAGLRAQLPAQGFRLDGVEVLLGVLVDLQPEELRAAMHEMLPSVEVKVKVVEALMRCTDCGAEYPPEEHPCPVCGSPHATLIHGQELEISRAWGETVGARA